MGGTSEKYRMVTIATSALDAASEETILANLSARNRDYAPLCLIITHRRTMLPYFDRLIEISGDGDAVVTDRKELAGRA